MKSWTRTLNLDDAHDLLAVVDVGMSLEAWTEAAHALLPSLSMARRRELVRMLRDDFLDVDDAGIVRPGLFLSAYQDAPAAPQIDLVHHQWALSHPLSLVAVQRLVAPALLAEELDIPLQDVESLVREVLETPSAESLRKTRTVLLGALEGIGVLTTRGTGQHRSVAAARGRPHPAVFAYLLRRELTETGRAAMPRELARAGSLAATITQCGESWADAATDEALRRGALRETPHGLA